MIKTTKKTRTHGSVSRAPYLFLGLFGCLLGHAQVGNFGNLHISDNAVLRVNSGNFTMAAGSKVTTSRTANAQGVLSLSSASNLLRTDTSVFLDGVLLASANAGVFHFGQGSVQAPLAFGNPNGAEVRLSYASAVNGSATDSSLANVAANGSWSVSTATAGSVSINLTLSWDNLTGQSISGLVVDLGDLTIAGFDGTKWVQIPSQVDTNDAFTAAVPSSLLKGSISALFPVDLTAYSRFTLASKGDCSPLVASSGVTKTWNGSSWSPSAPTLADPVVINAPYAGSLDCNALTLNADITLTGTQSVEIVNGVSGNGKIIMSTNTSVIQRASGAAPPKVVLTKETGNKRAQDYVYWGTPIQGNFFSAIDNAQALTSPTAGAFDLKFKYVSGVSAANGGSWQPLTAIETGRGFATRVKPQAPFSTPTAQDKIRMTFDGVANNGDVSVAVTNNPAALNGGTSHNLLANPYPSPIDAIEFLAQNEDVDGVVYLWTAASAPVAGVYAKADYLAYNLTGQVASAPVGFTFNGKIASGQGFKVKALNPGTVTFTNCMRLKDNASLLFRQADGGQEHTVADRFKLNLQGAAGDFSQILIAYMPEATLGYDRMYDAGRNSANAVQLYSVFEGDGRRLSINARPAFENTDIVPLGVSKAANAGQAESFTISMAEQEGVFAAEQPVYLHDKLLGVYHDFASGAYTFSTDQTVANSRFEVVYQASALDNGDFEANKVLAHIRDYTLNIQSKQAMKQVMVYDLTGRLIAQYDAEGLQALSKAFNHADGVYIARITLDNGAIATQKLITQK